MLKTFLFSLMIFTFFLNTNPILADGPNTACYENQQLGDPCTGPDPDTAYQCLPDEKLDVLTCQKSSVYAAFGRIKAPPELKGLLKDDSTAAGAISTFLSNGVTLFYVIATIALIFMLLWGAFDWMTSGGDKEKLAGAQRKMVNAVIGILLFAVAFAVIQVLGQFTGFKFFEGQK